MQPFSLVVLTCRRTSKQVNKPQCPHLTVKTRLLHFKNLTYITIIIFGEYEVLLKSFSSNTICETLKKR